jgi:hypothetical protein
MTSSGIEPATFRFVAKRNLHYKEQSINVVMAIAASSSEWRNQPNKKRA